MKRLRILLFPVLCVAALLVCWAFLKGTSAAGVPALGAPDPARYQTDASSLAVRVGLALVLIIALILGAVYTLKLLGERGGLQPAGQVRVLDRCFLAPKRALYTVRLGQRVVVVGVTEASITPVLELTSEEGERLYPQAATSTGSVTGFPHVLRSVAARMARLKA